MLLGGGGGGGEGRQPVILIRLGSHGDFQPHAVYLYMHTTVSAILHLSVARAKCENWNL